MNGNYNNSATFMYNINKNFFSNLNKRDLQ